MQGLIPWTYEHVYETYVGLRAFWISVPVQRCCHLDIASLLLSSEALRRDLVQKGLQDVKGASGSGPLRFMMQFEFG